MGKGKDRPADPSVGSGAALLIIDMISNMDFRHADELAAPADAAARRIKALPAAPTRAGLSVIYVNDNFGHSGMAWPTLVQLCAASGATAATLVRRPETRGVGRECVTKGIT